jgi:hypothetical protein
MGLRQNDHVFNEDSFMRFRSPLVAAALFFLGPAAVAIMSPAVQATDMADSVIEKAVDAGFTDLERQMVEKYFGKMPVPATTEATVESEDGANGGKGKGGPPGLAKRDSLPPGLARRETLPPGLATRDLPADLEEQLPPPPAGYERQIVGDSAVVLIDKATGKVADIIKDILIPGADD